MTISPKALYLELTSPDATSQVILTPAGFTTGGEYVPLTMYKRTLSAEKRRPTWRQTASTVRPPLLDLSPEGDPPIFAPITNTDERSLLVEQMLDFLRPTFKAMTTRGWSVRNQPIVVDVTTVDLDDVRKSTTPYKVIARIELARKALGFPAKIH